MMWYSTKIQPEKQGTLPQLVAPEPPRTKSPREVRRSERRRTHEQMIQCYRIREEQKRNQEELEYWNRDYERYLVEEAAYHASEIDPSPGEVVSQIPSTILTFRFQGVDVGIDRGDVLRDPKLRYVHPGLK